VIFSYRLICTIRLNNTCSYNMLWDIRNLNIGMQVRSIFTNSMFSSETEVQKWINNFYRIVSQWIFVIRIIFDARNYIKLCRYKRRISITIYMAPLHTNVHLRYTIRSRGWTLLEKKLQCRKMQSALRVFCISVRLYFTYIHLYTNVKKTYVEV